MNAAPRLHLVILNGRPVAVPDPRFLTRSQEDAGETTPPAACADSDPDTGTAEPAHAFEPDLGDDSMGLGEIVFALLACSGAGYFGAHVALAIQDAAGAWAIFGGPY